MNPEAAPMFTVQPLPAVLSGLAEAQAYLRLPDDFLRTWLDLGNDKVPAIPHFRLGQKICFPTEAVIQWLCEYHGYGGEMRHPSMRPKTKRKGPARQSA